MHPENPLIIQARRDAICATLKKVKLFFTSSHQYNTILTDNSGNINICDVIYM